ncbi:DUF4014 family protein [Escherichia coli]|nr:DUF4014 family protein [Escherichia coli]
MRRPPERAVRNETLFRKNYPRKSRTTEFLFFILFIVLMIPISPLLLVWIIGRTFEPVIELYTRLAP